MGGPNESHGTEVGPIQFCGCTWPMPESIVGSLDEEPIVGTGEPDCEWGWDRTKLSCIVPAGERADMDDMEDMDIVESGVWTVLRS